MNKKKIYQMIARVALMATLMTGASAVVPQDSNLNFMHSESAYAAEIGTVTVTTASLWTYSRADWNAKVAVVSRGAKFTAVDKINVAGRDMYRLSNGRYITANTAYIQFSGSVNTSPTPDPSTQTYVKTTANLNMRSGSSTAYGILAVIPSGTTVPVAGRASNGWYQVTYNGKTGYVSNSYVQSVASYSEKTIKVPYINQYSPVYAPMGCEGASLLMAMQYKNYTNVNLKTFLDNMPKTARNPFGGFSSTPYAVVKGEPAIFQSIFPEALTNYGKTYNANVFDISGYTTDQLKAEIDKGNPVVAYVTTRSFETPIWKVYNMGEAGNVNIVDNMHVMVLTGYNSNGEYQVTDPANSKQVYWVSKAKFETAYNALKWAVVAR